MKTVHIRNLTKPLYSPLQVVYCDTFLCRLRGLMFRRKLDEGEGLLLVYKADSKLDASIHMLGMRLDLGVVWIDSSRQVVDLRLARRWRPAYLPKKPARYVLEIVPNRLQEFQIGDEISLDESDLA